MAEIQIIIDTGKNEIPKKWYTEEVKKLSEELKKAFNAQWITFEILRKQPNNIPVIVAITMLILAIIPPDMPYSYYVLLRGVVFLTSLYLAFFAKGIKVKFLMWISGIVALVFNPIIPIHLNRNLWGTIDFWTAIYLWWAYWLLNKGEK